MFKFEKLKPLDTVRDKVNKQVNESSMPIEDFESSVGVYGGKIEVDSDDKMVWNNQGLVSKIDKFGDAILRTYDEHLVKNMEELLKRHPRLFFKFLAPGTKRYRGNKEEIFSNIKKLGLEDTYGLHEKGIEIKDKELYTKGLPLQDLYRADLIDGDKIKDFDRFQALEKAGSYLRGLHDRGGGIGEVLASDIIFKKHESGQVDEPVLNIPDIVFNEKKNIGEKEKKATDILDFIISIGVEEFRISKGNEDSIKKAMKTVLESYADKDVIKLLKSYIKRGRLTLLGDKNSKAVNTPIRSGFTIDNRAIFTKHNEARVVNDKDLGSLLKDLSLEVCEDFILENN